MEVSKTAQDGILLIIMLRNGICMGAAYDGLRIFRKMIPHQKKWMDREDLVFWICAGLLFFDDLVRNFNGEVRLSYLLLCSAGAVLYEVSVSALIVKAGTALLKKSVGFFGGVLFPVWKCIKWLKNLVKRGNILLYGHFAHICKRRGDRGERKHNGESRI